MEYLSLYDYLGKAAGGTLGKEVAQAAYDAKIQTQQREVSNPAYTGKILLYPKDFLDFYFRPAEPTPTDNPIPEDMFGEDEWEMFLSDRQDYDDDLPF